MPRIARKNLGTPFLHVMVQGVNKEYIFYDEEHIKRYLKLIKSNKKNYNFTIIAYCIMNNHAHFLIYTQDIKKFGQFMQKVNLIYAQKYNKEKKRCGVLFRNRYQTEPIYNEKYLINCIKYIHDNPVKAGIVKKSEEYKYSSCYNYMNNIGECKSEIMKELLGKNCDFKLLFENLYSKRFMDNDEDLSVVNEYITDGIREFVNNNKINYYNIFDNRKILKELIYFLKEHCNIKYVEIRNYFDIPRTKIDMLKIKS